MFTPVRAAAVRAPGWVSTAPGPAAGSVPGQAGSVIPDRARGSVAAGPAAGWDGLAPQVEADAQAQAYGVLSSVPARLPPFGSALNMPWPPPDPHRTVHAPLDRRRCGSGGGQ